MARKFVTPPAIQGGYISRELAIPEDKLWFGVFSEALSQTIYPYNYVQIDPTHLTPEQASEAAYAVYVAWLEAGECGVCPPPTLPNGDRIWRRNPTTGNWEYLDDTGESWVEPTGENAIPAPTPRQEQTTPNKQCAAATNAVNVLEILYTQVLEDINNALDATQSAANFSAGVASLLGAAFYPPIAGIIASAAALWNSFFEIAGYLAVDLWDAEFTDTLICVFLDNSSVDGNGRVTFDFQGINQGILADIWTNGQYLTLVAQVIYMNSVLGAQGLNVAGGTTAVSGDCAHCDQWCYDFNFTIDNGNWLNGSYGLGTYSAGQGWVHGQGYAGAAYRRGADIQINFNSTITRVELDFVYTAGTFDAAYSRWAINDSSVTLANQTSALASGTYTMTWTGEKAVSAVRLIAWSSARTSANYSGAVRITGCRIEGTGDNPFGADNCEE
jgi:hypothetical protein